MNYIKESGFRLLLYEIFGLAAGDLAGLTITTAEDFSGVFTLGVTATSSEDGTAATTTSQNLSVTVSGVADVPTVSVVDVTGSEDAGIALTIDAALADLAGERYQSH